MMTSLVSSRLRTHRPLRLIVGLAFTAFAVLACSSSDDGSGGPSDSASTTGGTTSGLTAASTGSSNSTTAGMTANTTASSSGNAVTTTGTAGIQSASSSSTGDAGGATATATDTTGSNSVGGASSTGATTETATSSSTATAAGGTGAGGSGGGDTEGRSAGCDKAPGISSDQYNNGQPISIMAAGKQRRYILSVPENYDNTRAYRFVIAYHQLNGNDRQMYANDYYHLLPLSDDSTIFVAPNGQANGSPCTGMGDGGESNCGWSNSGGEDIALADAVVAEIKENFCIDTNRIFATGWSFGGSMSYQTACERPLGQENGFLRAIAIYSGSQLSGNCTPSQPVAYYASHGTSDSVLCYDNMSSGCQVGNGVQLFQNFAQANGCTYQTPTKVTNGNHMCTELSGCADGYPAKFCSHSGDHTPDPSDGGPSWQYQDVWDFFSQF
ncbi:MAG TPA: hypothetical protein VI197_14680 [Polyangiaceae bacterium]